METGDVHTREYYIKQSQRIINILTSLHPMKEYVDGKNYSLKAHKV